MPKPRFNKEQRERLLSKLAHSKELESVKRRRYNRIYRRSFFFRASWTARIVYILLYVLIFFLYDQSKGFTREIVEKTETDITYSNPKYSRAKITTLYFETNNSNYTANVTGIFVPPFKEGDTLLIEHNIFGRPIYFTKENWSMKYAISSNFVFYFLILFVTIVSMFFNDGLDRFTDKILMIIWFLNIISIGIFFFT